MDVVEKKKLLVSGTRADFLSNKLVLIVPSGQTKPQSFEDLRQANVRHIALGEPRSVPVGQYSEQTLRKLNVLDAVTPKAVYGMDVRQVLTYVERGDAEAGL